MLAVEAAAWAVVWDEVAAVQDRNPDLVRMARSRTIDRGKAIAEVIPALALLHPDVVAATRCFCSAVRDELGYPAGEVVTPRRDDAEVTDTIAEQATRIAELEGELRRTQAERDRLVNRLERLEAALTVAAGAMGSVLDEDEVEALALAAATG